MTSLRWCRWIAAVTRLEWIRGQDAGIDQNDPVERWVGGGDPAASFSAESLGVGQCGGKLRPFITL